MVWLLSLGVAKHPRAKGLVSMGSPTVWGSCRQRGKVSGRRYAESSCEPGVVTLAEE